MSIISYRLHQTMGNVEYDIVACSELLVVTNVARIGVACRWRRCKLIKIYSPLSLQAVYLSDFLRNILHGRSLLLQWHSYAARLILITASGEPWINLLTAKSAVLFSLHLLASGTADTVSKWNSEHVRISWARPVSSDSIRGGTPTGGTGLSYA